jgi:hypothetical protein
MAEHPVIRHRNLPEERSPTFIFGDNQFDLRQTELEAQRAPSIIRPIGVHMSHEKRKTPSAPSEQKHKHELKHPRVEFEEEEVALEGPKRRSTELTKSFEEEAETKRKEEVDE